MLTFLTSVLLGMEYGIGLGVAVSLGKILFEFLSARLTSELKTDEETGLKYVVLIPLEGLRFPTVDTLRKSVNYHALEFAQSHPVIVLDCLKWPSLDYTIAAGLVSLYKSLKKNDVHLVLQNVDPKWNRALVNAGLSPGELITAICEDESGLPNLLRKIMSDSSVGAENNPA
jgi:anti-anti-sigma regulatory factor